MKFFTFLLTLLFSFSLFGAEGGDTFSENSFSGSIRKVRLIDSVQSSSDSLAAGASLYYGPYRTAIAATPPVKNYGSVRVWVKPGLVASGDSVEISYQFLADSIISDTATVNWVGKDTLAATEGGFRAAYSLLDSCFRAIVVRFHNLDATAIQLDNFVDLLFEE